MAADPLNRAIAIGRRQPILIFGAAAAGVAAFALIRGGGAPADAPVDAVPPDPNADISNLSMTDLAGQLADALASLGFDGLFGGGGGGGSGPTPDPSPAPAPAPSSVPPAATGILHASGLRRLFDLRNGVAIARPSAGLRFTAYVGPAVRLRVAGGSTATFRPILTVHPGLYVHTSDPGASFTGIPAQAAPKEVALPRSLAGVLPSGRFSAIGSAPSRIASVFAPTTVFFPDGSTRDAPAGSVLPIAKGGLVGDITHVIVDGPLAGGNLIRHAPTYTATPVLR